MFKLFIILCTTGVLSLNASAMVCTAFLGDQVKTMSPPSSDYPNRFEEVIDGFAFAVVTSDTTLYFFVANMYDWDRQASFVSVPYVEDNGPLELTLNVAPDVTAKISCTN